MDPKDLEFAPARLDTPLRIGNRVRFEGHPGVVVNVELAPALHDLGCAEASLGADGPEEPARGTAPGGPGFLPNLGSATRTSSDVATPAAPGPLAPQLARGKVGCLVSLVLGIHDYLF